MILQKKIFMQISKLKICQAGRSVACLTAATVLIKIKYFHELTFRIVRNSAAERGK